MRVLAVPTTFNGLPVFNRIIGMNGGGQWNGLALTNGFGGGTVNSMALVPGAFGKEELGSNWIDPDMLGPKGVGDLSLLPGAKNVNGDTCGTPEDVCVLDNRHINALLEQILCDSTSGEGAREYFDALIGLAWPENAELWLCCSGDASTIDSDEVCEEPDYRFAVRNTQKDEIGIAPHFLTVQFEHEQQEALTAALIAKINVHGKRLSMDLAGSFDLGAAGSKLITRHDPEVYSHHLGNAWGNMFLDCGVDGSADGADVNHPLCHASSEEDRFIGRDSSYHSLPMFSCAGKNDYPTEASGKSCFSRDMAANIEGGCGLVAAVGGCDVVCVGGFCGVNEPPEQNRGSTNVLSVYMSDYVDDEVDGINDPGKGDDVSPDRNGNLLCLLIFLPVGAIAIAVLFVLAKMLMEKVARKAPNGATKSIGETVVDDVVDDQEEGSGPYQ